MTFLASSIALVLGPFLFLLGERHPGSRQALEGFILVTIGGIVGLHIVPEAWRVVGWVSLILLALGLAFPMLLEALFSAAIVRAHGFVVALAAVGVALHAALDGIALLPLTGERALADNELAVGVILHRLPVGMAVWWVLRPRFGTMAALATLLIVVGATALSYFLGARLIVPGVSVGLAAFQSFVAGSLVHVVLFGIGHGHGDLEAHDHRRGARMGSWAFRAGLLMGLAMVFLLPHMGL